MGLRRADGRAGTPRRYTHVSANSGCVSLFVNGIPGTGLGYHGNMAGCKRGTLWLHTYVNNAKTDKRIQEGHENTCKNTTSCTVQEQIYTGSTKVITIYAHGINRTTGGNDTAWIAFGNVG
ncbi:hypothetical protein SK069_11750 [Patulibacter brassicae]|uniref:Uncharacterized protein n=1 Tax=Patulibacter brassicae TaxID=1705717 RepID=A0ABU4VKE8_9ACTN|nr:hypothetical protein [Patulibacter brassicae]MDX8152273.1 hypothetical protein [Patulibacter brassicae]